MKKRFDGFIKTAHSFEEKGNHTSAIKAYTAAIALPDLLPTEQRDCYSNRGYQHYRNGDYLNAVEDYNSAINLPCASPKRKAEAYRMRATIYAEHLHDHESAIRDYTATIVQTVDLQEKADLYQNRAECYWNKGDYESAKRDYISATQLAPNDTHALQMLKSLSLFDVAGAARENERPDKELSAYVEILSLFPNNYRALSGAINLLMTQDNSKASLHAAQILQNITSTNHHHALANKDGYLDMIQHVTDRLLSEDITTQTGLESYKAAFKTFEQTRTYFFQENCLTLGMNRCAQALQEQAKLLSKEGLRYADNAQPDYNLSIASHLLETAQSIWHATYSFNESHANGHITLLRQDLDDISTKKQQELKHARELEAEENTRIEQSKQHCTTLLIGHAMNQSNGKFSITTEGAAIAPEVQTMVYQALNHNWDAIAKSPELFVANEHVVQCLTSMIKQTAHGRISCGNRRAGGEIVFRNSASDRTVDAHYLSTEFERIFEDIRLKSEQAQNTAIGTPLIPIVYALAQPAPSQENGLPNTIEAELVEPAVFSGTQTTEGNHAKRLFEERNCDSSRAAIP